MTQPPPPPQRRRTRLGTYDYATPGAYFVTICSHERQGLFGTVDDGSVKRSALGDAAHDLWHALPDHHRHVALDAFVVMPNHVHGIVWLLTPEAVVARNAREGLKPSPTQGRRHALPEIIRGFKTFSARRINAGRGTPGTPVWQRSFHDHVIRERDDLNAIRDYIRRNPAKWDQDRHNPEVRGIGEREAWEDGEGFSAAREGH